MSTVTVTCTGCGNPHEVRKAEWNRCIKKNPSYFFRCSLKCLAEHGGKHNLGKHLGLGNPEHLNAGNRQDDFSPFRYFLGKARNRKQYGDTDLDLPYLKSLWESQGGRCPLSGVRMRMPENTLAWQRDSRNPLKPSLDRIDSSKGYVKGNVRFVTVIANLCKQGFSDEDVIAFGRAVASAHPSV